MTSRTRYAEFSGDAADLRLMLEKAKTSATRKDEHGLARMVFEGVDLTRARFSRLRDCLAASYAPSGRLGGYRSELDGLHRRL